MSLEKQEPEALPPPSAELVLLRVFLEAHLATIPPKQAKRFMRRAEDLMELFESGADVAPIRAGREGMLVGTARKNAAAWYRRVRVAVLDRI